ncbi:hypothetical protein MRX96_035464 [Rhipicephalus microplus]
MYLAAKKKKKKEVTGPDGTLRAHFALLEEDQLAHRKRGQGRAGDNRAECLGCTTSTTLASFGLPTSAHVKTSGHERNAHADPWSNHIWMFPPVAPSRSVLNVRRRQESAVPWRRRGL